MVLKSSEGVRTRVGPNTMRKFFRVIWRGKGREGEEEGNSNLHRLCKVIGFVTWSTIL